MTDQTSLDIETFLSYAIETLVNTDEWLTKREIIQYFLHYAMKFSKEIKYSDLNQSNQLFLIGIDKKEILHKNLSSFALREKYLIIKELCDLEKFSHNQNVSIQVEGLTKREKWIR